MKYWMSDVPNQNIMDIIIRYGDQIESNLAASNISFQNCREVILRWAIVFAKFFETEGEIRIGKYDSANHCWITIGDIIFDPTVKYKFEGEPRPSMYVENKILYIKDLGSGLSGKDFMTWRQQE